MKKERRVRLSRTGGRQFLRIPRDLSLRTEWTTIRRCGSRLVVEPWDRTSLLGTLARLRPIETTIGPIARPLAEPVEL